MDSDTSESFKDSQLFELTVEELTALIEESGNKEEKKFAKMVSELDEGDIDEEKVLDQLMNICFPIIGTDLYMLSVQLLHLKIGAESMKRLFKQVNSIFFSDFRFDTQLVAYMLNLGLEREVYFKESKLHGRPLNFICWSTCCKIWMATLKTVPSHIIVEGLRLKDKVGNTMLHIITPYSQLEQADSQLISYVDLFEYLSTFEGYEDALLVTNNNGDTPLLTTIDNCNCIDTLELLIATPGGEAAATILNKEGKKPYDMLLESKVHYIHYSKGDNVEQRFDALLERLEGLSKGLVKPCRG